MNYARLILRAVIGLMFIAAGAYTGWVALHEHPIDLHLVYVGGGGILLGGLVIDFDPIFGALKQLLSLLPQVKFGGNGTPAP
jgi:hypothetical protein